MNIDNEVRLEGYASSVEGADTYGLCCCWLVILDSETSVSQGPPCERGSSLAPVLQACQDSTRAKTRSQVHVHISVLFCAQFCVVSQMSQ